MAEPPVKRYRRSPTPQSEEDEDDFTPYVPVKERKRQQLVKLGKISEDVKSRVALLKEEKNGTSSDQNSEAEGDVGSITGSAASSKAGTPDRYRREEEFLEKNKGVSLLEQHKELQEIAEERKESVVEKQRKEEEKKRKCCGEAKKRGRKDFSKCCRKYCSDGCV